MVWLARGRTTISKTTNLGVFRKKPVDIPYLKNGIVYFGAIESGAWHRFNSVIRNFELQLKECEGRLNKVVPQLSLTSTDWYLIKKTIQTGWKPDARIPYDVRQLQFCCADTTGDKATPSVFLVT